MALMGAHADERAAHQKRPSGTMVRVTIIEERLKGGYNVQEEGRAQGTLTVGTPPGDVQIKIGNVFEVQVHDDDANKPQYRWPRPGPKKNMGHKKGKSQGGRDRRR